MEVEWPMDIFRGQSDATWPLSSSLQRLLAGTDFEENISNTEFWFLRAFKQRARQYLQSVPNESDIVGWLSLMQHHGTPTRLVDFTHSFYVACYFALINTKSDSAIWAIDHDWLIDIGHKVFNIKRGDLRDEWEDNVYRETNVLLGKLLATAGATEGYEKMPLGASSVEPSQHHQRLGTQQGLFVVPLDVQKSLLQNLKPHLSRHRNKPIKKIVLKRNMKENGLAHLREMNITSETLFPGIDGFARSIVHKKLCM